MKKHLVFYGHDMLDQNHLFLNLQGWLYWRKRLQLWKWKQRRTMGRPILVQRTVRQHILHKGADHE